MAKTSTNLEENIASLLCYVLLWVTGLIFYLIEKENKTVKFHAMQSLLTFLPLSILAAIINFVPYLWILGWVIGILIFILWIILIIKAYQGEKFKVPIVGDIAEKQIK
jgi:uncharacterized membrane protein